VNPTRNSAHELAAVLEDAAAHLRKPGGHKKSPEAGVALSNAVRSATPIEFTTKSVPCVASINDAKDTELSRRVGALSPHLSWEPSHRLSDAGETTGLMRANAMLELGEVIVGFLYVDRHQTYPEHEHEPQELYLILSGTAEWRHGGNEHYESIGPGQSFYNKPFDRHGVRVADEPLLALYVLWDFANAGTARA